MHFILNIMRLLSRVRSYKVFVLFCLVLGFDSNNIKLCILNQVWRERSVLQLEPQTHLLIPAGRG